MARAKRNEQQMGLFEDGKEGRIPRSARNDSLWQVKKRGSVGVSSHAENCGYDERTMKSLQERGWHLYKDGEKVW